MSEGEDSRPRKLPPLARNGDAVSIDPQSSTRRKKKRRDATDGSPRESRPRSNSRSGGRTLPSPRTESDVDQDLGEIPGASASSRMKPSRRHDDSISGSHEQNIPVSPVERKIRKKKSRQNTENKDITTSREALVENDVTGIDGTATQENDIENVERPKKKKKKRRPKTSATGPEETHSYDIGLAAELSGLQDDVIVAEGPAEIDLDKAASKVPALRSEPMSRLYIEQGSGFKSADKTKIAKKRAAEEARLQQLDMIQPTRLTTIQLGIATHRVFKTFSLFCHGLLAGFALWHIITVFTLHNIATDSKEFFRFYSPLSMPVQSLYYLLFVICTVSVFDRYDIGRPTKRDCLRCVTLQSGAVSSLIYFTSLIISLSIAAIDDKISLHSHLPSLWDEDAESELNVWRILNLIRGIGAILGWIIISLKPNTDRLIKNLESADENIIGDLTEHPDVVRSSGV